MKLRKKIKWVFLLLTSGCIFTFLSVVFINLYVNSFCDSVYDDVSRIQANKVGLLLGTSKYAYGRPNRFFNKRVTAAAQLYQAGKIDCLLVSGDNSRIDYNEPQDMKEALVELGVDPKDIYLDYAGFSTLDSVVRAKEVFNVKSLTVISQKFHCERAIYLARAHGVDAVGYAAEDCYGPLAQKVQFREYFARTKAFLDINVLHRGPKFYGDDPYQIGS